MELDPGFTREGFVANFVLQLVSVIGAFLVAALVYRWTRDDQWAIFRSERQADHQDRLDTETAQNRAIYLALRHEVDDNLKRLVTFWPQVIEGHGNATKDAYNLLRAAVPLWSTAVWQGAATTVAGALPQEQLIETFRLYTTLADIVEVQRRLQAADERDSAHYLATPETPSPVGGRGFKHRSSDNVQNAAEMLMPDIDAKVQAVLARGNPIPQ